LLNKNKSQEISDNKIILDEDKTEKTILNNLNDENHSTNFSCNHKNCNLKFKTKRQKFMHHRKLEVECNNEKNSLIKILGKIRTIFSDVMQDFNIVDYEESEPYFQLKDSYNNVVQNVIMDPDFFFSVLGDKFEGNAKGIIN